MKNFIDHLNPVQRVTLIWLCLMTVTILAALLSMYFSSGVTLLFISLAILIFKGQMIVDYFMDLRHVATHWRLIMSAYCVVIASFVMIAYLIGLS